MQPTIQTIKKNFEAGAEIFRRESVAVLLERIAALERAVSQQEYKDFLATFYALEIAKCLGLETPL